MNTLQVAIPGQNSQQCVEVKRAKRQVATGSVAAGDVGDGSAEAVCSQARWQSHAHRSHNGIFPDSEQRCRAHSVGRKQHRYSVVETGHICIAPWILPVGGHLPVRLAILAIEAPHVWGSRLQRATGHDIATHAPHSESG
jgi:hypothetical protein